MPWDDARIAFVGIVFIAIGVALFLLDFFLSGSWICGNLQLEVLTFIVAGIGFLYVAFSKKFRTAP